MVQEIDVVMRDAAWAKETWFLACVAGGRFAVVDTGMPAGAQIIAFGDTAVEACRKAIKMRADVAA